MTEKTHPRLLRERQTLEQMIAIYCRDSHAPATGAICPDCQRLSDYSLARLRRCPFQENKPTCAKCTVHCYQPAMREQIRQVMRYAGPRMLLHHPILAVLHLLDGIRKPPARHRKPPQN
jgi:hypothetical protein